MHPMQLQLELQSTTKITYLEGSKQQTRYRQTDAVVRK